MIHLTLSHFVHRIHITRYVASITCHIASARGLAHIAAQIIYFLASVFSSFGGGLILKASGLAALPSPIPSHGLVADSKFLCIVK